jgi:hypothetical protein
MATIDDPANIRCLIGVCSHSFDQTAFAGVSEAMADISVTRVD